MARRPSKPVHPWRRRIGALVLLALIVGAGILMWNARGAASGLERTAGRWQEINRSMP